MRSRHPHRQRVTDRRQRRGGAISVIAMIGLLVAAMIGTSLVRLALTRHRQVERESLRLQAEWLAEAGIERAASRLTADADYDGETWNLVADNFGRDDDGRVRITVEPEGETDERYRLTAVADYPAEAMRRARARQSLVVEREQP